MSNTEHNRRWAKTAGPESLRVRHEELVLEAIEERNPAIKASLKARAAVIMDELDRRQKPVPAGWDHI